MYAAHKKATMKLYFISGASGSGKTTILPFLQQYLDSTWKVYDFDSIGVPAHPNTKWRQESTEQWIQTLLAKKEDACLLGQMVLGEIFACSSSHLLSCINFCLLDVEDMVRIRRLRTRNPNEPNQDIFNWAAWLRVHHQDPTWTTSVITDEKSDKLDFTNFLTLKSWTPRTTVNSIDTTYISPKQIAVKVGTWIKASNNEHAVKSSHFLS